MSATACDICDAVVTNCPPFATWCECGLYFQACEACCKKLGIGAKGQAWAAHEKRHTTEVGR